MKVHTSIHETAAAGRPEWVSIPVTTDADFSQRACCQSSVSLR